MSKAIDYLTARVKYILLEDWDPIGIKDLAEAQDEYDSYVPKICGMLRGGCTFDELYKHLRWIESEHMGLDGDELHTSEIARKLTSLEGSEGGE